MEDRAGNNGMAVVSGKWAQGEVGGRPYISCVSPPFQKAQFILLHFRRTDFFYPYFKFFHNGNSRLRSCSILAAPFEPSILQAAHCCTADTQEWRIWLDSQLSHPASVTAVQSRSNTLVQRSVQACNHSSSAPKTRLCIPARR